MRNAKLLRNSLVVLGLLLAIGYFAYSYSLQAGIRARQITAAHRLEAFSAALFSPMDKYDYLPEITSTHPLVVETLEHPYDSNLVKKLNLFLEQRNRTADVPPFSVAVGFRVRG